MRLYGTSASPYTRKVRVVALELDIALEIERADAHAIPSDYGLINPINRIPALRLDEGSMVFDSRVICEYLDSLRGHLLLPQAGAARWQTLKLQALGDGVLDAAVPRYSELLRPPEQRSPARLAKYERSIRQILDALAEAVADLEGVNLGTLTLACALGYLDFRFAADDWRSTRPALSLWYERLAGRPSMAATQPIA